MSQVEDHRISCFCTCGYNNPSVIHDTPEQGQVVSQCLELCQRAGHRLQAVLEGLDELLVGLVVLGTINYDAESGGLEYGYPDVEGQ